MNTRVQFDDTVELDTWPASPSRGSDETVGMYTLSALNIPNADETAETEVEIHGMRVLDVAHHGVKHPLYRLLGHPDTGSEVRSSLGWSLISSSDTTIEFGLVDIPEVEPRADRAFEWIVANYNREQRVRDVTRHIRNELVSRHAARLAERIEALDEARMEEIEQGETDEFLLPESLEMFVALLDREPHLKYPTLTLTPNGHVFAEWDVAANRYFAIDFLPRGDDVRFVIFCPNPNHPEKRLKLSGAATVDSLMEVAKSYGVAGWVIGEG